MTPEERAAYEPTQDIDPTNPLPCTENYPHKDMPSSVKKGRLSFDPENPTSIIHYFELLMDSFGGIVKTDRNKKRYCISYLDDPQVAGQWKTLPEWKTGTFIEFKNAILRFYPEAEEMGTGSLARLFDVFARNSSIGLSDVGRLARLGLAVRPEFAKIEAIGEKTGMPIITNREVVERVMECLTPEFRDALRLRLSAQPRTEQDKDNLAWRMGPIEGRFKYTEVLDHAATLTREHAGSTSYAIPRTSRPGVVPFTSLPGNAPPASQPSRAIKPEPDTELEFRLGMEQRHDQLRDEIKNTFSQIQEDSRRSHREFTALKERFELLLNNPHNLGAPQNSQLHSGVRNVPTQGGWRSDRNGGNPSQSQGCFYCQGTGHFANQCSERIKHVAAGKIYLKGNDVYLTATGQRVMPFSSNGTSMSQRVDGGNSRAVNVQEAVSDEADYCRSYNVNQQSVDAFATQGDLADIRDSISGIQHNLSTFMSMLNARESARRVPSPPPAVKPAAQGNEANFREEFMRFANQYMNTRSGGAQADFQ